MERRNFLKIISAVPFAGLISRKTTAISNPAMNYGTPTVDWSTQSSPTPIADLRLLRVPIRWEERPLVMGNFGEEFFSVDLKSEFDMGEKFPGKHVFFNGRDAHMIAFDADLLGQWVGVLEHKWDNVPLPEGTSPKRIWMYGRVEIK